MGLFMRRGYHRFVPALGQLGDRIRENLGIAATSAT
jgi:hypothetical protein